LFSGFAALYLCRPKHFQVAICLPQGCRNDEKKDLLSCSEIATGQFSKAPLTSAVLHPDENSFVPLLFPVLMIGFHKCFRQLLDFA